MKKWGFSILIMGFMVIGINSTTIKAEEIDDYSSMQETVEAETENDEISVQEESPESVVEFDSETEQENVIEPQANLKGSFLIRKFSSRTLSTE